MILADKIIELRKRNGWSQEELAGKLGVSRQAISKWEGAQSTPDMERILAMSEVFGVSTDFLMKDEMEFAEGQSAAGMTEESGKSLRKVSMEEANVFLAAHMQSSGQIAFGVFLCIVASLPLVLSDIWEGSLLSTPLGLLLAGVLVACAVGIFLLNAFRLKEFEWMKNEPFETAYGVDGMVKERMRDDMPRFIVHIIAGVMLCILAAACFAAVDYFETAWQVNGNLVVAAGRLVVAIAVYLFVSAGIIRGSFSKLLQEEDYTPEKKALAKKIGLIMELYWLVITAGYLAYSFLTEDWQRSWIIWPVAGVLCGVLYIVLEMIFGRKRD